MSFGQLVIGPPGSGKTTYCDGMQQFMSAIGRKTAVINLDPANDALPYLTLIVLFCVFSLFCLTIRTYKCSVNVSDLVRLDAVMDEHGLGPNGALLYCMEYLEKNVDWLRQQLRTFEEQGYYFIFDCPGQVELYTHHKSMQNIVATFQKWNYRVTAVHLIDSFHCTTAANYISIVLLSLSTMLHLELPHINLLSKIDMVERYGKLNFSLEFYTEVQDLAHLQRTLDRSLDRNFRKLNKLLCEVVQDFALVSFIPLNIQNKESVLNVLRAVDKSNGYIYGGLASGNESIMAVAARDWVFTSMPDMEEQLMLSAFTNSTRDNLEDDPAGEDLDGQSDAAAEGES